MLFGGGTRHGEGEDSKDPIEHTWEVGWRGRQGSSRQ